MDKGDDDHSDDGHSDDDDNTDSGCNNLKKNFNIDAISLQII